MWDDFNDRKGYFYFYSILANLRRYMIERNIFCGMILMIKRDISISILFWLIWLKLRCYMAERNSFCGMILTIERDISISILTNLKCYMGQRNSFWGMILRIERNRIELCALFIFLKTMKLFLTYFGLFYSWQKGIVFVWRF